MRLFLDYARVASFSLPFYTLFLQGYRGAETPHEYQCNETNQSIVMTILILGRASPPTEYLTG